MTADNAFQTTFSLPRRTESLIIQKQKKVIYRLQFKKKNKIFVKLQLRFEIQLKSKLVDRNVQACKIGDN